MSKTRLDHILLSFYPQWTRSKIQTLIEKGKVEYCESGTKWKVLSKAGAKLELEGLTSSHFKILAGEEVQYVSRGALKLKKAIEEFQILVTDKVCLDVGLSTGGFTELLLEKGAKKILGIDVGQGQLHPILKSNTQLKAFDKVNAKEPLPKNILKEFFQEEDALFDLIVIDVSFISLTLVVPNILKYLKPSGTLVTLVKPQFELTRGDLNKKGVVRDPKKVQFVLEKMIGVFQESALKIVGYCPSPIEGENGNKEFLIVACQP